MDSFLTSVVAVTIVLGVMILVHEWGHFVAAKWFGVRVDVFSIGFGPRLWGWKRGDTDYRLSALPLGGYVKMAGDNPLEERSGSSDEFLSKTRWQRVVIAVAGPIMNVLLTLFIFWGIFWLVGVPFPAYLKKPAEIGAVSKQAAENGFKAGDRITAVNGVETPTWGDVSAQLEHEHPGAKVDVTVARDGKAVKLLVEIPEQPGTVNFLGYPNAPAVVEDVMASSPAAKAGIKAGDAIVAIDGRPIASFEQLVDEVHDSDGRPFQLTIQRKRQDLSVQIKPMQGTDPISNEKVWQIGVRRHVDELHEREGFLKAAKDSGQATVSGTRQIVDVMGGLLSGRVSLHQLMGPVGIARVSGEAAKQGASDLIELMAVISLNLGLLNLLPIPILDGGHVLMLAIEGVLRRDLSVAVKERFVQVGLVFLLGIFAFVMYSDILRIIQSH